MAACNYYPLFEKNQVLTSDQLNQIIKYFDKHDRLTRSKLIGVGIVCGFEVIYSDKPQPAVLISEGVGITSEGYIIFSESAKLTHYKKYNDIGDYSLFGDETSQTILYELLPSTTASGNSEIQKLTKNFLKDKAVILYLEIYERDLKDCTGDDCNEKGKRVELCVRKLLIGYDDLRVIISKCAPSNSYFQLDAKVNARFKLPDVSIGREADLITKYNYENYNGVLKLYIELIKPSLDDIDKALLESYERFEPILTDKYKTNPFKEINFIKNVKKIIESKSYSIQYVYDHLKDIILAYNEYKEAAFDLTMECCYKESCFPRHLMLGEALPSNSCTNSVFRHTFVYSPILNNQGQLLEKTKLLFERLERIVLSFLIPAEKITEIKITPSKEKGTELSKRAIPFYYKIESKNKQSNDSVYLHHIWNYDFTRKCKPYLNLSYHSSLYIEKDIPAYVTKPLLYDNDAYGFFRIEGHQGQSCDTVLTSLLKAIETYNLPLKVLKLRLGKQPTQKELNLDCRFTDISMMYGTLVAEYLCFLQQKMKYFSELDYKIETTTTSEKPGALKGSIVDGNKEPIVGTSIKITSLTSITPSYGSISNASGVFTIPNIKAGNYTVEVSLSGYKDYKVGVKIEAGQTKTMNITLDEPSTSLGNEYDKTEGYNLAGGVYSYDDMSTVEGLFGDYSVEEVKKMMSPGTYATGEFLISMEAYELSDNSVGKMYLDYGESKAKDILGFFDENKTVLEGMYGKFDKADLIEKYYQPIKLIEAIEELASLLPKKIINYNEATVKAMEKTLITSAKEFRSQVYKNLENPDYTRTGRESEIIIHLTELIEKCVSKKFSTLLNLYKQRIIEILKLTLFGNFIQDHPGAAHMAGVMPGGTFIIVCDENGIVVADFTLPYICCSDCPPIAFVAAPVQVIFKLPKSTFCTNDNSNYTVTAEPTGGVVAGEGVSLNTTTGQYEFNPSKAGAGLKKLTYKVNMNTYELLVSIIEVKPNFVYTVDNSDPSSETRKVTFTSTPTDADSYEWDFGDSSETSTEANPVHEYDLSDQQEFSIQLKVTKSGCNGEVTQKIKLSYCTAEFDYKIDRVVNKVAVVSFTSVMESGATHKWSFGDGETTDEASPMHKYDVTNKNSFDVIHNVTTDDCKDEEKDTIKIEICTADYSYDYGSPEGNTLVVYFTGKPADAKSYLWDFGDDATSTQGPTTSHSYILSTQAQKIKVKLTIQTDKCIDSIIKEITLQAAQPATEDIEFTIDGESFCKYDKSQYLFKVNVPGKVTGYGVISEGDYDYFVPSDDNVKRGINKYTFTSESGETAELSIKVLYPIAKFSVKDIVQPNPEIEPYSYQIILANESIGASKYVWRIDDEIVSDEENPSLIIRETEPGKQLTISLSAIIGKCSNTIKEAITIPTIATPVAGTTDNVTVVTYGDGSVVVGGVSVEDSIVNAFDSNLNTLTNLTSHSLFDSALSTSVVSYRDTKDFFTAVSEELSDSEKRRLYLSGAKDDEIAEQFNSIITAAYKRIEKYEGTTALKQRQFTYNLILLQLSQLFNLIGLQKNDIKTDGSIVQLLYTAMEIMTALRELKVEIDQNKQLSTLINATIKVSSDKPVLLTTMEKFSTVLNG